MTVLYDLETDGHLDQLTKIHVVVVRLDDEIRAYHDEPEFTPRHGSVEDGVRLVLSADTRVAHNGMRFDELVLDRLYPDIPRNGEALDTLILAKIEFPAGHLKNLDLNLYKGKSPAPRPGGHAMKDWGIRLGAEKLTELVVDGYEVFTQDMLTYAVRDVEILGLLWDYLAKAGIPRRAVELEHRFAALLNKQEEAGFGIDPEALESLIGDLVARQEELQAQLAELFPPKEVTTTSPKRKVTRTKLVPFNASSRDHIAERLIEQGWRPLETTATGKPKVDEVALKHAASKGLHGAPELLEHFLVAKRLGAIKYGPKAWVKFINPETSRIHGRIDHNGAVTHRCVHFSPNLGQVPGPSKDPIWGGRCRAVFVANRPGYVMVGVDASNLEGRGLAHYLARFDGGAFAEQVVSGDMHSAGMAATGMTERGIYKARFYALLYGAGDQKLGKINGEGAVAGRQFRRQIMSGIHGFGLLVKDLEAVFDGDFKRKIKPRKWLKALDGRRIHVRTKSAILNSLLQSFGAIVMKQATVNLHDLIQSELGLRLNVDYFQVAHVHDEFQLEVPAEYAERIAELGVQAIRMVADQFDLRCPLDGEAKIGANWAKTH